MEPPSERLRAFGNQLIDMHIRLREELDSLREGRRDLRTHCLAFCTALNRHHSGEDGGAFPALENHFPELRPVLDELRRDHALIEESLHRLETLLAQADTTTVRREIDSLAALMETHFRYEEKKIVSALNALNIPDWEHTTLEFLHPGPTP